MLLYFLVASQIRPGSSWKIADIAKDASRHDEHFRSGKTGAAVASAFGTVGDKADHARIEKLFKVIADKGNEEEKEAVKAFYHQWQSHKKGSSR